MEVMVSSEVMGSSHAWRSWCLLMHGGPGVHGICTLTRVRGMCMSWACMACACRVHDMACACRVHGMCMMSRACMRHVHVQGLYMACMRMTWHVRVLYMHVMYTFYGNCCCCLIEGRKCGLDESEEAWEG